MDNDSEELTTPLVQVGDVRSSNSVERYARSRSSMDQAGSQSPEKRFGSVPNAIRKKLGRISTMEDRNNARLPVKADNKKRIFKKAAKTEKQKEKDAKTQNNSYIRHHVVPRKVIG